MSGPPNRPPPRLAYEVDAFFNEQYNRGLEITGTPEATRRRERFYNLIQFFLQCTRIDGLVAECGCWRGLSSYIMCHYWKQQDSGFKGDGYHVFDSFRGLSKPTETDALSDSLKTQLVERFGSVEGAYTASLSDIKTALSGFPEIQYHKGWIPRVFQNLPEAEYRFVHIDLDLYEPTRGAIEYFYPRLVNGGLIVCDDYGSLLWAGAKQAVDSYCATFSLTPILVSTGQAVLWKKGAIVKERSVRTASLRQSLADARMQTNHLQAQNLQLQSDLERVRKEVRDAQEKLSLSDGQGSKSIADVTRLRDEIGEKQVQMQHFSTRFAEVKAEAKTQIESLHSNLAKMRAERDEVKAQLTQTSSRFAELKTESKAEAEALRSKLAQHRKERDEAKSKLQEISSRFAEVKASAKAEAAELREQIKNADDETNNMRALVLQLREERNRAQAQVVQLAARLAEVKSQLREKQETAEGTSDKVSSNLSNKQ